MFYFTSMKNNHNKIPMKYWMQEDCQSLRSNRKKVSFKIVFPWLFPDFWGFLFFTDQFSKFPDNSLTLKKYQISLTFQVCWQPCFIKGLEKETLRTWLSNYLNTTYLFSFSVIFRGWGLPDCFQTIFTHPFMLYLTYYFQFLS